MRVRIIKDPLEESLWWVQTKYWWSFGWIKQSSKGFFLGHRAKERALEAAKALLNPEIIEVE